MLVNVKRGLAAAAALAVLAMGAGARADSVTYYTEGFFGTDTPVLQTTGSEAGSYQDQTSSGVSSITFDGAAVGTTVTLLNGFSTAKLGDFFINSNNVSGTDHFNVAFTLELFQTNPALPSSPSQLVGSAAGDLTGSVTANTSGSSVNVVFTAPFTFSVPPSPNTKYIYTVPQSTPLNAGGQNQDTTLNGTVTELPLPTTASAGLVMLAGLGVFGGLKKLRERNAASLAV